jgi:hypothetical protein
LKYVYRARIRAAVLACLFLLTPHSPLPTARGQPAFFEPKESYYKAKAFSVRVKWEVPNAKVEEGRELSATLVITGAKNPTELQKPDLAKVPKFAESFKVTDAPDAPRKTDDKEVRFNYKLSPRQRTVAQVPSLDFYFFNLAAPPGKNPFRLTRADAVDITVTEPPPPVPTPMTEADRLFHVSTGPEVLRAPFVPCRWAWLAAALFGPLAALAWFRAWRWVFPDAAKMAQLRRSRAARRAAGAIRRAHRTPDPPAAIASAVLGYLRTRFPLPESAATPSEIAAALVEAQVPSEVAGQVEGLFRDCDRARFAPPGDSGASLAEEAEAVITRLEAIA